MISTCRHIPTRSHDLTYAELRGLIIVIVLLSVIIRIIILALVEPSDQVGDEEGIIIMKHDCAVSRVLDMNRG